MLNGRVDLEMQLFFFLIRRNRRRWTENNFVSMGFLRFGGGTFNILRFLGSLLSRTTGFRRVRHGLEMQEKLYKK
jgi:hypothetical protein